MSSVESVRRKLTLDDPLTVSRKKTDLNRSRRRLDFGESDPVVLQNCPGKRAFLDFESATGATIEFTGTPLEFSLV